MENKSESEKEIERLTKIIEENPEDSSAFFLRGIVLDSQKQYEEAIRDYDKAIELDPENTNIYISKAGAFQLLKRYEESILDYNKAIELDPNNASAFVLRGMVLDRQERYEEAIRDYNKVIELDPNNADAFFLRGMVLDRQERYEEAIRDYNKVIELDPNNADAYINKGHTLDRQERYEEAILDYNKVIESDPNNASAYINKGNTLGNLKRYEEAILDYNKAIELDPNNASAYYFRGMALDSQEQYEEAILDYNKVIELDPNNAGVYYFRGMALGSQEQYEKAVMAFDRNIELDPANTIAYYFRGITLGNLKRYEEAILDYNKAIELDPDNVAAYYFRGMALSSQEQYKEAINDFNKIIKLDPENTKAILMIGKIYFLQKKWKKAAFTFNNAKEDVLGVLTMFNETKQVEKVVSYMLDLNKEDFFNKTINGNGKIRQYKSIYIIVLQIIYLLHVKSKNEISFAHYTKRSTATFLLFENSKFRLNSIITANDPQEGKTLIEYLFGKKSLDEKETNRNKLNHDYQAFIGCFTFNHESLNQFRLYGKEADKEATGVSLVLNKKFFNDKMGIGLLSNCYLIKDKKEKVVIEGDKLQRYAIFRCIYIDPVTHKIVSLGHKEDYSFYREKEEIPEEIIDEYKKEIDNTLKKVEEYFNKLSTEIKADKDLDKNIICELLLPLRYLVKHVAFKEEQECRIFDIKDLQEEKFKLKEDREVKFTPDYAQMYIEYQPITDEHLEKVIFAPKARGIEIFEKAAEQKGLEVKCEVSTHPFS
nr:tetratricopeptide repeat protein [uncultured Bacteroides sp.]